MTEVEKFK